MKMSAYYVVYRHGKYSDEQCDYVAGPFQYYPDALHSLELTRQQCVYKPENKEHYSVVEAFIEVK